MSSPRTGILSLIRFNSEQDYDVFLKVLVVWVAHGIFVSPQSQMDLELGLDNIWLFAPYYQFIMTLQSLLFM